MYCWILVYYVSTCGSGLNTIFGRITYYGHCSPTRRAHFQKTESGVERAEPQKGRPLIDLSVVASDIHGEDGSMESSVSVGS